MSRKFTPEERKLYELVREFEEARIRTADIFVSIVYVDKHDCISTVSQLNYAKSLGKPIYIVKEKGAQDPPNLEGVDVKGRAEFEDPRFIHQAAMRAIQKSTALIIESTDLSNIITDEPRII